jgi:homocysteine S-methyltransferase
VSIETGTPRGPSLFEPFLNRCGVVILDGGLATELERRGADLNDSLWSAKVLLENPQLIRQVHRDYLEAGANVVTSASYQAGFEGLSRRGLDHRQAADLMRLSVRLACDARSQFLAANPDRKEIPLVAASIGCYGAILHDGSEYRGDYGLSVKQLMDWHRPRLEVLADSGADLLACETIPCQTEAEALVRVLSEFPHMSAWLSFSCRDSQHVGHGEKLADCVTVAETGKNIVAVGINCTAPHWIEALLATFAGKTTLLPLVYPNSGEVWDAHKHAWLPETVPCDWPQLARTWHAAGARLIGGCCRTTPETIRQITSFFKQFSTFNH